MAAEKNTLPALSIVAKDKCPSNLEPAYVYEGNDKKWIADLNVGANGDTIRLCLATQLDDSKKPIETNKFKERVEALCLDHSKGGDWGNIFSHTKACQNIKTSNPTLYKQMAMNYCIKDDKLIRPEEPICKTWCSETDNISTCARAVQTYCEDTTKTKPDNITCACNYDFAKKKVLADKNTTDLQKLIVAGSQNPYCWNPDCANSSNAYKPADQKCAIDIQSCMQVMSAQAGSVDYNKNAQTCNLTKNNTSNTSTGTGGTNNSAATPTAGATTTTASPDDTTTTQSNIYLYGGIGFISSISCVCVFMIFCFMMMMMMKK
jgi:hypothetical protein